ncbi:DNA alkylation repair protein [Myroides injenensis]|uniref:DNA alkylation repair protein n=1 Tax=Myroides injenensis TaxID=1183151 RepID=UPI000289F41E|nr:DNA alkylation repair protein [Myroides injenensis]
MEKRKGARSKKDISPEIMVQLNEGLIESANLTEWLAIDQRLLLINVMKQLGRTHYVALVFKSLDDLEKVTVNTINQCIGKTLFDSSVYYGDQELFFLLKNHTSDLVRCWATYFVGYNSTISFKDKLSMIKEFASDEHFGVREICWMAVRKDIFENLEEALAILLDWTNDDDENIRRFVTESTRPRGVWSNHIEVLKKDPSLGLPILEALKNDESKYVLDSVANWINDASKSNPEFCIELLNKWKDETQNKNRLYIIKKASRSIEKKS